MTQEQTPDHRSPQISIKILKKHIRSGARLLPKNGERVMGRSLPPEVIKGLRDNLAAELRELRQYPDNITLEEARRLRAEHD